MHALFFGTKRAFHATLRILRKPLKAHGLTPARFDLMYLLAGNGAPDAFAYQSDLRKKLGVTTPTVSRMLDSLQELGLVRTERGEYDRRQRVVHLTKLGFERMRAAFESFMGGRVGQRIINRAFAPLRPRGVRKADAVFGCMCEFDDLLGAIRRMCGDTAALALHYRWHPDD
jgi:DNA-binding MarR family transcriptional regulator